MARITVEDCLTQENNRFALVQLASKRTKQLLQGSGATVAAKNKAVVTALREIAAGSVRFMTPDEAKLFEEQRVKDLEAARAVEAEREQSAAAKVSAALFGNGSGNENRTSAFLQDSLMKTGPIADDDEEE